MKRICLRSEEQESKTWYRIKENESPSIQFIYDSDVFWHEVIYRLDSKEKEKYMTKISTNIKLQCYVTNI